MIEIRESERKTILNNYKFFSECDLKYYHERLTKRIEYLNPLLNELESKNMNLTDVSMELAQEVFEITELLKFLNMFKVKI